VLLKKSKLQKKQRVCELKRVRENKNIPELKKAALRLGQEKLCAYL
jgi:hypothetical protein